MPIELRISIPEDSPAGHALKRMVATGCVTPEQAAERRLPRVPSSMATGHRPEKLIGAFASPEDRDAMDRAIASARAHRAPFDRVRDLGF